MFLIFWQNREKFDKTKKLNTYLAGIARNLIRKKYRNLHTNSNIEEFENYIIYDICDFEKLEKHKIIENTLNIMPKVDKEIFVLYYYYSKSIKDISKKVKLSELSIKSRLYRIRKNLKKELEKGGYSYE